MQAWCKPSVVVMTMVLQHPDFIGYSKFIVEQPNLPAFKEISGRIIIFGSSLIIDRGVAIQSFQFRYCRKVGCCITIVVFNFKLQTNDLSRCLRTLF